MMSRRQHQRRQRRASKEIPQSTAHPFCFKHTHTPPLLASPLHTLLMRCDVTYLMLSYRAFRHHRCHPLCTHSLTHPSPSIRLSLLIGMCILYCGCRIHRETAASQQNILRPLCSPRVRVRQIGPGTAAGPTEKFYS